MFRPDRRPQSAENMAEPPEYKNRLSIDSLFSKCRGDWIRTSDHQLPKLAR